MLAQCSTFRAVKIKRAGGLKLNTCKRGGGHEGSEQETLFVTPKELELERPRKSSSLRPRLLTVSKATGGPVDADLGAGSTCCADNAREPPESRAARAPIARDQSTVLAP